MSMDTATIDIRQPVKNRRIGELLVSKGVVSEDQVRIALTEQRRTKEHLGRILVRLGFATEGVIRDVLGGALGYDSVDLSRVVVDSDIVQLIPKHIARRYHMVALTMSEAERSLTVAMVDPFNVIALDQVRALLGGDLNAPVGRYRVDVAVEREGVRIAAEYDSWYWHAEREEEDAERDAFLLNKGWQVLHVRSNELLPTDDQLDAAIERLVAGEQIVEIVLADWGVGPTRRGHG